MILITEISVWWQCWLSGPARGPVGDGSTGLGAGAAAECWSCPSCILVRVLVLPVDGEAKLAQTKDSGVWTGLCGSAGGQY